MKLLGAAGDLDAAQATARRLLAMMDEHLTGRTWLVGETATLADIACYPYLACASEGGLAMDAYPQVRAWIARVEALPRLKPMPRTVAAA
jgi:glutathione S-transferase